MSVSHAFSLRVRHHPLVAEHWPNKALPLVLAVNDELLVGVKEHVKVTNFLTGLGVSSKVLTTLLAGIKHPGIEDVEILQVKLTPKHDNIFDLTKLLRAGPLHADQRKVSPNHVLIPAW